MGICSVLMIINISQNRTLKECPVFEFPQKIQNNPLKKSEFQSVPRNSVFLFYYSTHNWHLHKKIGNTFQKKCEKYKILSRLIYQFNKVKMEKYPCIGKSFFGKTKIGYLGFWVTRNGVRPINKNWINKEYDTTKLLKRSL